MAIRDPDNALRALHFEARDRFVMLSRAFEAATGLDLQVRSGLRSCAQQAELYGIGRTYNLSSKPVTYARGCRSWHVLGRAVDADPVSPATGKRIGDCATYRKAGEIWEHLGGIWGGRWAAFGPCGDSGHFEYHPGLTTEEVCPDPGRCDQIQRAIVTSDPWTWRAAVLGVATVGALLWIRTKLK